MVRRERRDKTRARKRKSGTSVNFQLQLTHPSLSLPLFVPLILSVNEIYMFTRYHGNFLFSPSRNYPRFILPTPTPPLPSARVFRDPGIVRRFRPGLHAARERFDWRMANAGRNCFRQNHLNDIFPFLTLLYRALSFLHTFSFSSACLRSNIFFFSFFLPSSSLVPEIFNRVHDS